MSKEMNTEEAIEICEEIKRESKEASKCALAGGNEAEKWNKEAEAIETVLADRERLIKERDGIYEDYQDLGKEYYNSIPKDKIKEKTEQLKEEYKKEVVKNSTKAFILKCQIEAYEELLKEGDKYERYI